MEAGVAEGQTSHARDMLLVAPRPERRTTKFLSKPPETSDIAKLRKQICEHKLKCQAEIKEVYRDNLTELFYLQNGLNFMDSLNLKKRPNIHLKHYLRSMRLDESDFDSIEGALQVTKAESSHALHKIKESVQDIKLPQR